MHMHVPNKTRFAVLFDLDGVLTDTAELHFQAWRNLADSLGIHFDRHSNERLKGVSRVDSLKLILGDKQIDQEQFQILLDKKNKEYVASLSSLSDADVLPGIPQLLADLKDQDIAMVVASASKNARSIIDRLGLAEWFVGIADGNSVTRSKPSSDVFLYAAGLARTPSNSCIVVEDSAAGIRAAQDCKMACIGIGAELVEARPNVLVSSTAELTVDKITDLIPYVS